MKTSLYPLLVLLTIACNATDPETKNTTNEIIVSDTIINTDPAPSPLINKENNVPAEAEAEASAYEEDSLHMVSDFYGDDALDAAFLVVVDDKMAKKRKSAKDSIDNMDEEEESWPYCELHFHGKGAPKFRPIGRADVRISNEGDLDDDGKEDVSVVWLKPSGEDSWNEIYACKKGKWVLGAFLLIVAAGDRPCFRG
ncbi:hypothetical protein [Chitinophaga pinensis]|uniref:VCBS repeat-containing protein n=1 Tax=Chitinophaga pinensis TaxID=79329 RepID=A0A5C6LLD3_9BACT|nr:hypothetical protein [Chitinophaga pinensis]TWV94324.1 hypothetical protein FEF09_25965 [Chitinophaga pinensis]